MDDPSTPPTCPSCNTPLEPGATEGLCPRCLMLNAMEPTVTDAGSPDIPEIETVAEAFPDLEILELIGRGGMGAVFKARQKSLDRFVALKLLPQSLAEDPQFPVRFETEAKALAALGHTNIVTIHDFGQAGGFYFLLMEFVDGPNLRELIRSRKLSPDEALAIVPPLCEALQFAHVRGIVHRDIKPENLLLHKDGRIKIADFGIARIIGDGTPLDEKPAGTPAYMAPEQSGAPNKVDSRADIYSLGVVLYEMLTGEQPGDDLQPPSSKVAIDVRLDEVVLRALDAEPERRWQTVADLRTQIDTIATQTASKPAGESRQTAPSRVQAKHAAPMPRGHTFSYGLGSLLCLIGSVPAALMGMRFAVQSDGSGSSALQYSLLAMILLGLLLGGLWLWKLRGTRVSRAAWAAALTTLSLAGVWILMVGTIPIRVDTSVEHESLAAQSAKAHEAVEALSNAQQNGAPAETIEALQRAVSEAENLVNSSEAPTVSKEPRGGALLQVSWRLLFFLSAPFAILGCVFGWSHLYSLRRYGAPFVGAGSAGYGALLWPIIIAIGVVTGTTVSLLDEVILQRSSTPYVLGIIFALVATSWMIHATIRWVRNDASELGTARSPWNVFAGVALIVAAAILTYSWWSELESRDRGSSLAVRQVEQQRERELPQLELAMQRAQAKRAQAEGDFERRLITKSDLDEAEMEFSNASNRINNSIFQLDRRVLQAEEQHSPQSLLYYKATPICVGLGIAAAGLFLLRRPRRQNP